MSNSQVSNKMDRDNAVGKALAQSIGKQSNGFVDPAGIYPRKVNEGKSQVGTKINKKIQTYGLDVPDEVKLGESSTKGLAYTYNTPAGHIIEYNDTPGNERILLRHKSGTAINLGPDGSVVMSSSQRVDLIGEDHTLTAHNGQLTYNGNLTLNVTGDFNINVGGEYKVKSTGHEIYTNGNYLNTTDNGDYSNIVNGSKTETVVDNNATTILGENSYIVKGNTQYVSEGASIIAAKDILKMSSEVDASLTSEDITIASTRMSVIADEGTIGGENIIMYNYNMETQHTIHAIEYIKTNTLEVTEQASWKRGVGDVIGNLEGIADHSETSTQATYASKASIAGGISVVTPTLGGNIVAAAATPKELDDSKTSLPTWEIIQNILIASEKGISKILIDQDNVIKNNINMTEKTGGVSPIDLDENAVRQQMRDPGNRSNAAFVAYAQGNNSLSYDQAKPSPAKISYVKSTLDLVTLGQTPIGNVDAFKVTKRIKV